jgi:hypothetical protein
MQKTILLLLLGLCSFTALFGRKYPRGAILDKALYNSLPPIPAIWVYTAPIPPGRAM